MRRERTSWGRTGLLLVMTLPFLYPFVFLLSTALKSRDEFVGDPVGITSHPTTANLSSAWSDAGLGGAMVQSLIAVGIGVVLTVALSAMAAFWFLRHTGRLASAVRTVIIATMLLPVPVFIIPLFLELADANITDNAIALGFVYAAWNSGFGLFLVFTYMRDLPSEVTEAAVVDGAGPWQLFWYIVLPLCKPVLATLGVLAFLWSWSDLLISVVLMQDPGKRTVTAAVATLTDQYSTNIPTVAAAVLIALVPLLAIFLVGQRFLVRGITAGVGK